MDGRLQFEPPIRRQLLHRVVVDVVGVGVAAVVDGDADVPDTGAVVVDVVAAVVPRRGRFSIDRTRR